MGCYQGRYFIRRRTWLCGEYPETEIYPVFQAPGKRRKKCKPTRRVQELINQRDAERKLVRLVNANFTREDYALDLTFDSPLEVEEAVLRLKAYFRRIRRIYRRAGEELRYIYITERGKISGKVHFHLFINRGPMSREALEEAWEHGYANTRKLRFGERGVCALITYLTKSGRKKQRATYRRWTGSKNLLHPQPVIEDGAVTVREAGELAECVERRDLEAWAEQAWPGYTLVEAEAEKNQYNGGTYISICLCALAAWQNRRPAASYISGMIGEEE